MWKNILGHTTPLAILHQAFLRDAIPHAYLFTGISGIGKRLAATTFAAALVCTSRQGCGNCQACQKVWQAQHPDVFFVAPDKGTIKIDAIRSLKSKLSLHALEGQRKIVIIDDVDQMTEGASNAFLKALEEPTADTHFILITSHPHLILSTIRSRCQTLAFSPLPDDIVTPFLEQQMHLSPSDAKQIAKLAQGSLGLALTWDVSFIHDRLTELQGLWTTPTTPDILHLGEEWARDEEHAPLLLDLLLTVYRDSLCLKEASFRELIHPQASRQLKSRSYLETCLQKIIESRFLLTTTANKQLLFEDLLFTLAHL